MNNNFIYRIFIVLPQHSEAIGKLVLQIEHKETATSTEKIFINWWCHFQNQPNDGWFACTSEWKPQGKYQLRSLMLKMEKAKIRDTSTVEEVMDLLHDNNIHHALWEKVYDTNGQLIFNGNLTMEEIYKGKFKRGPDQFVISATQQKELLQKIIDEKNIDIPTTPSKKVA